MLKPTPKHVIKLWMSKKKPQMKMLLIKLKMIFLAITLASCASVPPFPSVEQDAYSIKFNKFRGCNSSTHECRDISRDDPSMEAAQCLSADDYKKSQEWVQSVINIANQRCK